MRVLLVRIVYSNFELNLVFPCICTGHDAPNKQILQEISKALNIGYNLTKGKKEKKK
jgi:hypothetical protein